MAALRINVTSPADPLLEHAANELSRYVRTLFGFTPATESEDAENNVAIDVSAELPDQVYRIASRENGLDIVAGSSRAALWGVYGLVSHWGVHFLVQGDVFPDDPGPFRLPDRDSSCVAGTAKRVGETENCRMNA